MVTGMFVLSISSILSGLSWDLISLLLFRFFLGVGAALFFSPAAHTLRIIIEKRRQGLMIGLYNAAFSIGAGIALLSWYIIATITNWRIALILGGILGLLLSFENHFVLENFKNEEKTELRSFLKEKTILYLGIATSGFWGLNYTLTQFIYSYFIAYKGIDENISGIASSLTLLGAIAGNLIVGELTDRKGKRMQLLICIMILIAIITAITPLIEGIFIWIYTRAQGFLSGGAFALSYALVMDEIEIDEGLKTLTVSTVNALNIGIGSLASPIYTYSASILSPSTGWYILVLYELILMIFLLPLIRSRKLKTA